MNEEELEYGLVIAERLENLGKNNAAYTHYCTIAASIRENVAVFRGEIEKREYTSFGESGFFDWQIRHGEHILCCAAHNLPVWKRCPERENPS